MKSWLTGKDSDARKDKGKEEKGMTKDEMVGWHHWLNGHEFEQVPGDSEGQGSLVCRSPWGSQRVWQDLLTKQQQQIDQWKRTEIPETYLYTYGQWIFNKGAKTMQWRKAVSSMVVQGYPCAKEWSWTPISNQIQKLTQKWWSGG